MPLAVLLQPVVALALISTPSRPPLRQGSLTEAEVSDASYVMRATLPRHVSCRIRAAPTMGFGLTDRESARLSQMKRTDEPLVEEVRGLYIVGATGGLVFGPLLFGSSLLGMIVGVQVGPSLAFTGGPRGERMRATGWESWRLWGIQVRRARRAWLVTRREAEARGLTPLLRCSCVESSRPGASAKAVLRRPRLLRPQLCLASPAPDQAQGGLQSQPQPRPIGRCVLDGRPNRPYFRCRCS